MLIRFLSWKFSAERTKCVHVVSFCNLIGTARARRRKSTNFPADVTTLSLPSISEERAKYHHSTKLYYKFVVICLAA